MQRAFPVQIEWEISQLIITVREVLDPAREEFLNWSIALFRWELILEEPFLPPGLSVMSRIRVSSSIRPAFRRAFVARAFEPVGGAVGAENMGAARKASA